MTPVAGSRKAQSGLGARMMSRYRNSPAAVCRGPSSWQRMLAGIAVVLLAMNAFAQAPAAPGSAAPPPAAEELEKLVGPIALYPDDLVAIILPAATNPLQLVQADRFLEKRKADPKLAIDDKWDDAVKSLLNYPDVVKTMSADLDWTSALGEAVVADQGEVLEAIQSFRRKAQAAGNLKSDDKQVVVVEKEIITVVPADPQVIYVPQYNPTTVVTYGVAPYWGYYPTPYPSYYYPYPPGAALATGVIWGAAIGAAWAGGRYGANYGGDANINVNRNTNINTGNINTGNVNRGGGQGQAGGGTAWKSNKQPGQVSSSVGKTASTARAGDARGAGAASAGGGAGRASASATGAGAGAGRAQAAGSVSAGGAGRAQAAGSVSAGGSASRTGGGDGLSGYGSGSGRQTQMDSSRGASSRSSMSGASARPTSSAGASRSMPSGGGARGGGGGGRGGGGGGRR
ncbi:MAG: DUF3300 domain-containing protein [Betaproteobacteria bacterium]|nr:DUF3300 domain-containing protein [Betaproteobacteria bacterium]